MAEVPQIPEDQKSEPKILTEVNYRPGQKNKVAFFSSLETLPIKHAFSWGKESGNMSPDFSGEEGEGAVVARIKDFLEASEMEYRNDANTAGIFEGSHLQMQEIVFEDLKDQPETRFESNFMFTRDPRVLLSIRPGDCNASILYAKDRMGRDLVGIIHSSAQSANAGLPRYAIEYLIQEEDVDISTIKIGITPGISRKHYSINQESDAIKNQTIDRVIVERNWKQHIDQHDPSQGDEQRRHVDILGATIMQYVEAGVSPENIEAIDVDTWEASARGESFSREHSNEIGKPQGRYMVAVQLKNKIAEMPVLKALAKAA
nr:laccase domain-containing protein [Candidatus Levybacteria bacterium]